MALKILPLGLLLLGAAACAPLGIGEQSSPTSAELSAPGRTPEESATLVSRSIWGVVSEAPERQGDVKPSMITGSAVAVSESTLLASCSSVADRARVGLVRHTTYRIASVASSDAASGVCTLAVTEAALTPAASFRSPGDLKLGEPVYAFVSQTSRDLALAEGVLIDKSVDGAALTTSLSLPAEARSAVLFDGEANLLGFAHATPAPGLSTMATPLQSALVPTLANRDAAPDDPAVLAALEPEALRRTPRRVSRFRLGYDRQNDNGPGGTSRGRETRTASADGGSDNASGGDGDGGSDNGGGDTGSGGDDSGGSGDGGGSSDDGGSGTGGGDDGGGGDDDGGNSGSGGGGDDGGNSGGGRGRDGPTSLR